MMFVKSINWIDKDSHEAEVIVTDGDIEVICFSHPFKMAVNDAIHEPIHCLGTENVVLAREPFSYANKNNGYFGYSLCGKLIDRKNKLVYLDNIILCLDDAYISDSIPEDSYVEFNVSRFDLY